MSTWQALALALSIFNAIICLWLGITVWLDGEHERGPRLAASGMLMAGIFFLVHAAVVGKGEPITNVGIPFWWRVISVPSLLAPYAWYATMVWYTGVGGAALRIHKLLLGIIGIFISILVLLLTAIYPLPPQLRTFALRIVPAWLVAGLPFLIAGYLLVLIICFVLPIQALLTGPGRGHHLPQLAWMRVRVWLIRTSLFGLLAGFVALGGAIVLFSDQGAWLQNPVLAPNPALVERFFRFDLAVLVVVGAALGTAGQAVGAYAAFTERPLPQWNRMDQWRWLLFMAAAFALLVAISNIIGVASIYTLLIATTLAALAYALLSWRYRTEHQAFMDRLRPFVSSLHLRERLLDGGASLSEDLTELVEAVCRDVLRAERACLILRDRVSGLPPAILYRWDSPIPELDSFLIDAQRPSAGVRIDTLQLGAMWAIPLWDGRGLAGALILGAPQPGVVYNEEAMEVAAACCARITDALAGERAARMVADVLRQRIAEVKVLGIQGRRTLHDDILPQIHAALIHLSALPTPDSAITGAIAALSDAHVRLAALIRTLPPATPHRLEHVGLLQTLRDLVLVDFKAAFDSIEWQSSPEITERLQETPHFVGEVISYAVQEALRNAARHARDTNHHHPLHLEICLEWRTGLHITIKDNGIGIDASKTNGGAGAGLSVHRGLLAVLGGSLNAATRPEGGTQVTLWVPEELWGLPARTDY